MHNWASNGWIRREKGKDVPIKNIDLWKRLFQHQKNVSIQWIKGHNGDEYNEQVDTLVRTKYQSIFGGNMKY